MILLKVVNVSMGLGRRLAMGILFAGMLVLATANRGEALETDTAYWNEFVFRHKLQKRLGLHLKTEHWYLDDMSRRGLYNFTPGVKYNWSDHVDFELNYRYQRLKLLGELTTEHRVEIIPYLKGEWAGFHVELRNRLELRNIDGENSLRLRERIQIKRNFNYKEWVFDYYVSHEFFYDSNPDDFNQYRTKAGVVKEVVPGLNVGLYYMYWMIEGRELFRANVIGTAFSFLF